MATMDDKTFEPDVICNDETETVTNMNKNGGFLFHRQLVSTDFVPSTYHTSQQLQQYVVKDFFPLKYNQ